MPSQAKQFGAALRAEVWFIQSEDSVSGLIDLQFALSHLARFQYETKDSLSGLTDKGLDGVIKFLSSTALITSFLINRSDAV